jgi:hypothetical protein
MKQGSNASDSHTVLHTLWHGQDWSHWTGQDWVNLI